ncbi:uncharacterized protein LOC123409877 [Hordeum vulgare subsp. vulgare]|uniref:Predicted protein n=1 Tax=Hordeum vulgare subsp. vulgare TaxID=112509 RepID=F2D6F1_HORVV|nr:uncharacterized protein LOC123409877 [Hordeum vulgare subsp. vulgare]BAJ90672.1 predicted protein [Hordeum vulgare subsp. vulgare]
MAGEKGPFTKITAAVSVQDGQFLKPCSAKRKADEAAAGDGDESHLNLKVRSPKRKAEAAATGTTLGEEEFASEKPRAADAVAAASASAATKGDGAAPARKKTRLPQEEVDRILARAVDTSHPPRFIQALRSKNPSLLPSPEEETDASKVALYATARMYYESRQSFAEYQAWVLSQLHDKGYVEVDDEAIAVRAELRAYSEQARKEALRDLTRSHSDQD